jgi:hypothetical protein
MSAAPTGSDLPDDLPRSNGELVFETPWESRAFGLAAAYVETTGAGWDRFRQHLIAAIATSSPETPYYEAWVTALEALLVEDRLTGQ